MTAEWNESQWFDQWLKLARREEKTAVEI